MTSLLVASTGGHLVELQRLWPRLVASGANANAIWMTFDTPQSRSSLEGAQAVFLREVAPRDYRSMLANVPASIRMLRAADIDHIFSTGAGVALSVLPIARSVGLPCYYIESAARTAGPSLTGRLLCRTPGVHTYCQYRQWASSRWPYIGSIFDAFRSAHTEPRAIQRIVVMLGTIPYPFQRLVTRVRSVVPRGVEVLWQLGSTAPPPGLANAYSMIPEADLRAACSAADAIIAHAGVGSALLALEAGRVPILAPRLRSLGEHVDDHQLLVSRELSSRGLAHHAGASHLRWRDVDVVAPLDVTDRFDPPPLAISLSRNDP